MSVSQITKFRMYSFTVLSFLVTDRGAQDDMREARVVATSAEEAIADAIELLNLTDAVGRVTRIAGVVELEPKDAFDWYTFHTTVPRDDRHLGKTIS